MTLEENKALVLRFLQQVWNERNLAIIDEALAADYVHHASPIDAPPGRDAYRQVAGRFLDAFPDLHTTVNQVVAEGDKVVVQMTDRGTHHGEFMGIPPTGKSVAVTGTAIYRVAEGKIAEEWVNYDSLSMLQQLGAIPAPKQA